MFRRTRPDASPTDAHARPAGTSLLDVREDDEWDAGHAPGATHVALGKLRADALPVAAQVLCICRSGARSARAAEALRAAGIDATNVAGGMSAWVAAGLPVVRDDGGPGVVI
jgi:rhodanese-related sulfurtransferase